MSKWLTMGLALLIFAAAGCNVVAPVITSRGVVAINDDEQDVSRLHNLRQLNQADLDDSESLDPSKLSDHILNPFVVSDSANLTAPNYDNVSVQGSEPAVVSNETVPAVVRYETKPTLAGPYEHISQFPDVTLSIKPFPTRDPASDVGDAILGESSKKEPLSVGRSDVKLLAEPAQDCIRPGDLVLWLEPQDGSFSAPVGEILEVSLCLSNLSVDLAGFDLVLNLGHSDVAEFTKGTLGGFGLESHSPIPTNSLRVRAIDLKQQLNAGSHGILLATLWIAGNGVGESPLTIEIKAIDDKDGYSVNAQVLQASLRVTER